MASVLLKGMASGATKHRGHKDRHAVPNSTKQVGPGQAVPIVFRACSARACGTRASSQVYAVPGQAVPG